jgi:quinol monooxygenase YgiN
MRYLLGLLLLVGVPAVADDRSPLVPPSLVERLERTLKADNKPFTLVTQLYIRVGTESRFEAAAVKAGSASLTENGCLAYEFHHDLEKPGHYILIERWTGLAPLRNHLWQQHTKEIQTVFGELSTTPRTTDILAPVIGLK